jgi:hypothetical protein
MKIIRAIGITFALLTPALAFATPNMTASCCMSDCCYPGCPFCPSGLHK